MDKITIPTIWYRLAWLGYIIQGLALEISAIFLFSGEATLSAQVWWLLALVSAQPWGAFGVAVLSIIILGFFAWVSLHFMQKLMARGKL